MIGMSRKNAVNDAAGIAMPTEPSVVVAEVEPNTPHAKASIA